MKLLQHDRDRLNTVEQVQEALAAAGENPYEHIVWAHQRHLRTPMGSYVARRTAQGYRLETEDRGSTLLRGTFPDEASLVAAFLEEATLDVSMTPAQQAEVRAAGRRDAVEQADHRAELEAQMWRTFYERKKIRDAGGDPDAPGNGV